MRALSGSLLAILLALFAGGVLYWLVKPGYVREFYMNKYVYRSDSTTPLTGTLYEERAFGLVDISEFCDGRPCGDFAEYDRHHNKLIWGSVLDSTILSPSFISRLPSGDWYLTKNYEGAESACGNATLDLTLVADSTIFRDSLEVKGMFDGLKSELRGQCCGVLSLSVRSSYYAGQFSWHYAEHYSDNRIPLK